MARIPMIPALGFSALILFPATVSAQVLPDTAANRARGVVGCVQSSSGITCGGRSSGGGSGAYYQHQQFMNQMMMNTMQGLMNNFWAGYQQGLERRRRRQSALNLNNAGIAYAKKGNWTAAVTSFRNALHYSNDPLIRKNLAWAEEERSGRAEARRKAERERRQKITRMIGQLSDKLNEPPFERSTVDARNELDFLTPKGTAFFGLGGEAPPPVDLRHQTPDENGLAFMPPGGQIAAANPQPVPATLPSQPTRSADVQVASRNGGLQFLSPDAETGTPPAAAPAAASTHPDTSSPKAAMLLDALAFGERDWNKSRDYLLGLQKRYPDDTNISDAIDELDRVRKLAAAKGRNPPTPTPHVAALEQEGRKLIREGKFLEARGVLGRAYWEDPTQTEIADLLQATHLILVKEAGEYKNFARTAVRAGNYGEAELLLRAAVKRAPNDSAITRELEAIDAFDRHEELMLRLVSGGGSEFPIKPMMLERDADKLMAAKDYSGALRKLDQAAHLAPDNRRLRERFFEVRGMLDAKEKTPGANFGSLEQGHPYGVGPDNAPERVGTKTAELIARADKALVKGDVSAAMADAREAQMYEPGNAGLVDFINYLQGLADFAPPQ